MRWIRCLHKQRWNDFLSSPSFVIRREPLWAQTPAPRRRVGDGGGGSEGEGSKCEPPALLSENNGVQAPGWTGPPAGRGRASRRSSRPLTLDRPDGIKPSGSVSQARLLPRFGFPFFWDQFKLCGNPHGNKSGRFF